MTDRPLNQWKKEGEGERAQGRAEAASGNYLWGIEMLVWQKIKSTWVLNFPKFGGTYNDIHSEQELDTKKAWKYLISLH